MNSKKSSRSADASRALIWDIAKRSGVSIATVSRVLNGRPDVSPETRERVMRHVREMGYVSNRQASAHNTYIGLLAGYVHNPYFGAIVGGVADAIVERGDHLIIAPTYDNHEREVMLLENLVRGAASSALLMMPQQSPQELLRLQQKKFPFVIIDPGFPLENEIPVVATANISGSRQATEHLLSLGHRHVGLICGPLDNSTTKDRLVGYHSTLLSAGITYNPDYICSGGFAAAGGYEATHTLLSLPEPPTAIFAMNDLMALGALQAAQERGVKVPEQLSIVGFDDTDFTQYTTPALTTIRQPLGELGKMGVDLLYRIMNGQPLNAHRVELSTRLIIRASTAPCKEAQGS